ncbi:MAG: hypothetical protein KDC38_10180 [Planctomycetes bacterium]|nr:hypothetical protein [Planctomycetota bacterium]
MNRPLVRWSHRARVGHRLARSFLVAILMCSPFGCSSAPRAYTPAEAARAKVSFLRREGARLTPYQVSLIHDIPYAADPRRLEARMRHVLVEGVSDPDQPDGYRTTKLSERLIREGEGTSGSTEVPEEGTPQHSREDEQN